MAAEAFDASVLVATYNQLESTSLALAALFAQRTDYTYEVIVCDDGSDSATVAGLLKILEASPVPSRLAWQQDRGFRVAASRNNGIRLARGSVLILLDGDMMPEEDFVDQHVRGHAGEDRLLCVGSRLWRNPEPIWQAACSRPIDPQELWRVARGTDAIDKQSQFSEWAEALFRLCLRKRAVWTDCFGCNISLLKKPEVEFDESYVGWGFEDWDLFYGLTRCHGYRVEHVESVAYEVSSWRDRVRLWPLENFTYHLANGMRFLDKWAETGLEPRFALPQYELDPWTNTWCPAPGSVFSARRDDWPEYVAHVRQWLQENGRYP